MDISSGSVVKFVFPVSHAPVYVKQIECGIFLGTFAHVENVAQPTEVAFHLTEEKVEEYNEVASDRLVLEEENTPFAEDAHPVERRIPRDKAIRVDFDSSTQHVVQLINNQYLVWADGTVISPNLERIYTILEGNGPPTETVPRTETPIRADE